MKLRIAASTKPDLERIREYYDRQRPGSSLSSSDLSVFAMTKRYRLVNSQNDFEVHASGGPIDSPKTAAALFMALGHASAAWARMELMLDAVLMRINKVAESNELYNPVHPVGFKQKVDLMKKWLDHPKLSPHKETFRETLIIFKELANSRNDFLHSDIRAFDTATGQFTVANIKVMGNDTFRVREMDFNIEGVRVLADLSCRGALALSDWLDLLDPPSSA